MTAMLLCVKTLKFFFCRTTTALRLILGILLQGLKIYPVCSHDYPKMIFDIFYEKVKFVSVAVLEECCMASADTQWLFYPSERIVTHEGLALFHVLVRRCDINFNEVHFLNRNMLILYFFTSFSMTTYAAPAAIVDISRHFQSQPTRSIAQPVARL